MRDTVAASCRSKKLLDALRSVDLSTVDGIRNEKVEIPKGNQASPPVFLFAGFVGCDVSV